MDNAKHLELPGSSLCPYPPMAKTCSGVVSHKFLSFSGICNICLMMLVMYILPVSNLQIQTFNRESETERERGREKEIQRNRETAHNIRGLLKHLLV